MFLIHLLIILFIILIIYQILLANSSTPIIEGLENSDTGTAEYKPYNINDPNNALILAQQNAGNIEVLKGRIDGLEDNKNKIVNMQQQIDSMQTQIDGLVQQQTEYAQQIGGSSPPTITGTETESEIATETTA